MQIKRAYFKAVRFLHPDKLPGSVFTCALCYYYYVFISILLNSGSLELAQRMIAEHAFAYLSEVFQAYREIIATEEER